MNPRNHGPALVLVAADSSCKPAGRAVFHARPADRCEPWPAEPTKLGAIRGAAQAARIDPNLAGVLIVERSILDRELDCLSAVEYLEERAKDAQISMELCASSADYLRALNSRATGPAELVSTLRLPMRLSDRVLRFGLADLLRCDLLASAIHWERAALATGMTMSEWAFSATAAG